ncbi:MAG: hypothetical protein QG622_2519 [Actinomycetota bacterium]|nr:hypothetical protein [Actinomycetota bacterium]
MTQSAAVRAARPPAPRPGRSTSRGPAPQLRVVTAPVAARSQAGLAVGCLGLLAVGLVALLLLNLDLEQGAFVRKKQQLDIEQLQERRQALAEEIVALEAPQSLARRAAELGMVEAPNAAFVRARDGRVLGVPSPGVASKSLNVTSSGVPASGRGTSAGPAVSSAPQGTAVGTAKVSPKVTGAGTVRATTTATPGAPTGQRAAARPPQGKPAQGGTGHATNGATVPKVTKRSTVTATTAP